MLCGAAQVERYGRAPTSTRYIRYLEGVTADKAKRAVKVPRWWAIIEECTCRRTAGESSGSPNGPGRAPGCYSSATEGQAPRGRVRLCVGVEVGFQLELTYGRAIRGREAVIQQTTLGPQSRPSEQLSGAWYTVAASWRERNSDMGSRGGRVCRVSAEGAVGRVRLWGVAVN